MAAARRPVGSSVVHLHLDETWPADEVLPLQVTPAPSSTVRVLVGRFEVMTAERVEAARSLALSAGDASRVGRFAEPLLLRAAAGASPADRTRLEQLVARWAASTGKEVTRTE